MPGILSVRRNERMGYIIDELEVILGAGEPSDFENRVIYVPAH